jgi:hypothetical protein
VHNLKYTINGEDVSIWLNGSEVPINEFVIKIFKSTTYGILNPLKGVTQPVRKVLLTIKK